jgi:hypothetical protein
MDEDNLPFMDTSELSPILDGDGVDFEDNFNAGYDFDGADLNLDFAVNEVVTPSAHLDLFANDPIEPRNDGTIRPQVIWNHTREEVATSIPANQLTDMNPQYGNNVIQPSGNLTHHDPFTNSTSQDPISEATQQPTPESMDQPTKKGPKAKSKKGGKSGTRSKRPVVDAEAKRPRFLERNRLAASKCRSKKKQAIEMMEKSERQMGIENKLKKRIVEGQLAEIDDLRRRVLEHDCPKTSRDQQTIEFQGARDKYFERYGKFERKQATPLPEWPAHIANFKVKTGVPEPDTLEIDEVFLNDMPMQEAFSALNSGFRDAFPVSERAKGLAYGRYPPASPFISPFAVSQPMSRNSSSGSHQSDISSFSLQGSTSHISPRTIHGQIGYGQPYMSPRGPAHFISSPAQADGPLMVTSPPPNQMDNFSYGSPLQGPISVPYYPAQGLQHNPSCNGSHVGPVRTERRCVHGRSLSSVPYPQFSQPNYRRPSLQEHLQQPLENSLQHSTLVSGAMPPVSVMPRQDSAINMQQLDEKFDELIAADRAAHRDWHKDSAVETDPDFNDVMVQATRVVPDNEDLNDALNGAVARAE